MSKQFDEQIEFPGPLPTTVHKGTGPYRYRNPGNIAAVIKHDHSETALGMDIDEVQTLVDFLIEVLEEHAEANAPKPLEVSELQVGGIYQVVDNDSGHGWDEGTLVHYLGIDEEGEPLCTSNINHREWSSGDLCWYVADGDLAYVTESVFQQD